MKLDIGSGPYPKEGYIHLDILPFGHVEVLGTGNYLPFKDESFSEVRLSHVLEHFTIRHGLDCLLEAYRVLGSGGKIEVAGPNFLYLIDRWEATTVRDKIHFDIQKIIVGDHSSAGQFHMSAHDPDTVTYLLRCANFRNITVDLSTRGPRDFIVYGVKG